MTKRVKFYKLKFALKRTLWALTALMVCLQSPPQALASLVIPPAEHAWNVKAPWSGSAPEMMNPEILKSFQDLTGRNSVRVIYSRHATAGDSQWVTGQLEKAVRELGQQEVVLWIEHAQPAGLPLSAQQARLLFHQAGHTETGFHFYEALLDGTAHPEVLNFLRKIYDVSVTQEDARRLFENTQDPFTRQIREGIRDLEQKHYRVRIRIENAPFESYVNLLRRDAMSLLVPYWLDRGEETKAMAALYQAFGYYYESLELRDKKLTDEVASTAKDTAQVIFRGLAHESVLDSFLTESGLHSLEVIQKPDEETSQAAFHRFLSEYRRLPDIETPEGRLFFLDQLEAARLGSAK